MGAITFTPNRVDLLQRVLRDCLLDAMGAQLNDIVWGNVNQPRLPRPYGHLAWTEFPRKVGHRAETGIKIHNSKYDVIIDSVVLGDPAKVVINGVPYSITPISGDTLDTVRDRLVVLINDDEEPVTALATGVPGQLTLTETQFGSIFFVQSTTYTTVSLAIDSEERCVQTYTDRNPGFCTFQIIDEKASSSSMGQLITMAMFALDLDSTLLKFQDNRVSYRVLSPPINLSDVTFGGAQYEGRASFDIELVGTTMYAEPATIIEQAEVSLDISGNISQFTTPSP